jgi:exopolysaccharide production protein ExoZ
VSLKSNNGYYYGLDLVRFFSALIVAIFHLTWKTEETEIFAHFGWIGVQIFFVLSGFVIANSANNTTVVRFIRSRFLRLYPAAMICAVISCIVVSQNAGLFEYNQFIRSFFLLPSGPYLATAYWTLPIELAFYTLIAFLMFSFNVKSIKLIAPYLAIASSSYILFYSLHTWHILNLPYLEFGYGIKNTTLLRHGVFFSIGIYFWLSSVGELQRKDIKYIILSFIAGSFEVASRSNEIFQKINSLELSILTGISIPILIFYGMCLLMFISIKSSFRIPLNKMTGNILRTLGLTTYPFYLLHENVGNRVKFILINHFDINSLASAFLGLTSALIISVIIAIKIEPIFRGIIVNILNGKNTFASKYIR